MSIKKEFNKIFVVLIAVVSLFWTFSARTYALEKKGAVSEKHQDNSADSQKKKQEKEYAKWKIKENNGAYFYKQKSVRLLVDDAGDKAITNKFYMNKKGDVDIKIIRNKKGKIKKVEYISKKKAEKMLDNCNYVIAYVIDKK